MYRSVRSTHEAIHILTTYLGFMIPEARYMKGTSTIMRSKEILTHRFPPVNSSIISNPDVTARRIGAIRFLVSIRTL